MMDTKMFWLFQTYVYKILYLSVLYLGNISIKIVKYIMPNEEDVRYAASTLYRNTNMHRQYPSLDASTRSHSVNYIAEDFIAGYMHDGRMSVVRRFFCLFVTFDLVFISLLWLICIMITGDSIYNAFKTQILHYSIYTSLFDIVMAAIVRFTVLLLFYALLYINHWSVIALSTSGSCSFLIAKVFVFDWLASPQPVFQVLLIVISFVLAWGEAWFLDCRVIPQEQHARSYFSAATSGSVDDRTPLMAPFLNSTQLPPESILNFYSPYDSVHNSDDEDEQDDDYKNMGIDSVRKAYELLQSGNWKIEMVTTKNDTIKSTQRDKIGKIYRLTAKINFPAKDLLHQLFYNIEDIQKWNPTILESRIVKKIDSHTDITYQATLGGGGGLIKCRDFVNLRCWQLFRNGQLVTDDLNDDNINNLVDNNEAAVIETSTSTPSSMSNIQPSTSSAAAILETNVRNKIQQERMQKSSSDLVINEMKNSNQYNSSNSNSNSTLSKSLGAKHFSHDDILSIEEEPFFQAEDNINKTNSNGSHRRMENVYISAAFSIPYPSVPMSTKYIRGENLISCWAMQEIPDNKDSCIFEWLLCIDLKGFLPRSVLNSAYTTLMQDYMSYLRKHCEQIHSKQLKVPDNVIV